MYTKKKLVIAGNIVSLYEFEKAVAYGNKRIIEKESEEIEEKKKENTLDSRRRSMYRARKKIINLVNANCEMWKDKNGKPYLQLMYTFTFRDDIRDVKTANFEFTKFIQRLNYKITSQKKSYLKYVNVIEFQDETRGVIHYHTIFFNLPYVDFWELSDLWGQGYAEYEDIDDSMGVAKYVSKYISKSFDDERLCGEKCYFISRGLKQPIIVRDANDILIIRNLLPEPFYQDSYDSEYVGQIDCSQYYLKNGEYSRKDIMQVLALWGYSDIEL